MTSATLLMRLLPLSLLCAFALPPAPTLAGAGPNYAYGEAWWEEYESDARTALLLHFGRPQARPSAQLAAAVNAEKKEADLLTLEGLERAATGLGDADPKRLAGGPGPIRDDNVPPGIALDYSDARQRLTLPPGMTTGPGGRFGDGLILSGGEGLRVRVRDPRHAEAFFKVDAYPQADACLFSLADDESRVLLRPDGRLELRLRQPHGIPDPEHNAPEQIAAIRMRTAAIVSPRPMPLGRWIHVAIRNQPHPMPGGGEPFDARLMVDGDDVAWYLSERYNRYAHFFGRGQTLLAIGNSAAGDAPFAGRIDEVRLSTTERKLYARPKLPWRDTAAAREPPFGTPWFRNDATVFHLPFDKGLAFARGPAGARGAELKLTTGDADALLVEGIRGRALLADPAVGFPRVPLTGMRFDEGAVEFWVRPVNFDDVTGYWHHSPPARKDLSAVRLTARNAAGESVPWISFTLERAHNIERGRLPLDPGHWLHVMIVWRTGADGRRDAWAWLDGSPKKKGGVRLERDARTATDWTPDHLVFGVADDIAVKRGEPPRIEIDEVCGYASAFEADEAAVACKRWQGEVEPVPLCQTEHQYKYSIHRVTFTVRPLLPRTLQPAAVDLTVTGPGGRARAGPLTCRDADDGGRYRFLVSDGVPVAEGAYRYAYTVRDAEGRALHEGTHTWTYAEEPWRHNRAGIVDRPFAPWTDVRVEGRRIDTRMTRYTLGEDGLPAQIRVDGSDLLAAPVRLLEDGAAVPGRLDGAVSCTPTEAAWTGAFRGAATDVALSCVTEFDGMTRFTLALTGKAPARPLQLVIPLKAAHATHGYHYPMGARGVSTFTVGAREGAVLDSRTAAHAYKAWRTFAAERKKNPALEWQPFWRDYEKGISGYGFLGHLDLNDRTRGLVWFCDNAAGWRQSPDTGAIRVVRAGDTVSIVLNLIPEAGPAADGARPIVFGLLPHPARPLPPGYRIFNKGRADLDPLLCDIYDAFQPWAADPRDRAMAVYPGRDPDAPEAGPSWSYAESCIPVMRSTKPKGMRTMYLSKVWFSCRAGAYDGWEWRSGENSAVSLTPSFVNYLCWEMDEWIKRDIWDAIYLDECYETAARNLEAGFSVRLPDGSEQPGVRNFAFRELMKRWRGIFVQHGKQPMLIGHHTYSWKYPGMVFCDSSLDGENAPIVSLNSRDWIDSTSKERFEMLQNARLWGVATFYMPFIAEGGFDNKTKSQFLKWQWRMARQAQSQFAHYETSTVYEGQGAHVYKAFWNDVFAWGGADETTATFHPYWDSASGVAAEGQGRDVLVSYYRKPGAALLIVSNRRNEETTVEVRLTPAALGLAGAARSVRPLDSGYTPPPGDDFVRGEKPSLDTPEGLPRLDGTPEDDLLMQTIHTVTTGKAFDDRIVLEGDTVRVPVRPRDFRMFVVE